MESNIYDPIELDFPNTFNFIKKVRNNAYQAANDIYFIEVGEVIVFDKSMWIMDPPFSIVKDVEMQANHLLSSLYANYFNLLEEFIKEI